MHVGSYLGDSPDGTTPVDNSSTSAIIGDISNVLTQGLSLYGQLQLQNMNMNLINQGKPPLTAAQISAMAPQLNVGLDPTLQNNLIKGLLIGGVGILAVLFILKRKRR